MAEYASFPYDPTTNGYLFGGSFFYVAPANGTVTLIASSRYAFTIESLQHLVLSAGTITAEIAINGTAVTGLSAVAVTSTSQNVSATAANTVAIGDRVTLVLSSAASAANLEFTMAITRTA